MILGRDLRARHWLYTGYLDGRIKYAKTVPPAWMKAMDRDTLVYIYIEEDLPSRAHARALEAIHAARFILKDEAGSRGGPWSMPTLAKVSKDMCGPSGGDPR